MKEEDDILKKVLTEHLSGEEKRIISEQGIVSQFLKKQWDATSGTVMMQSETKKQILNRILQKKYTQISFTNYFRRYGMIASVALLLAMCSIMIWSRPEKETIYVITSGRQSTESINLPDGTSVLLNAGSKLTYPAHFSGKTREVDLIGQAFFNVQHDKEHPFIVKTNNMDITAVGTSFEVFCMDGDSYSEMVLVDGEVKVNTQKAGIHGGVFKVLPNRKLICLADGTTAIEKVNANNYSAWRHGGKPRFKDEPLSMIIPRLESWYGTTIECPADVSEKYKFTFMIHSESLELLFTIMTKSSPIRYTKRENKFVLYEKQESNK